MEIKKETIEATELSERAEIIILNYIPKKEDQEKLFSNDDSVILEF